jgi:hypothetical protein
MSDLIESLPQEYMPHGIGFRIWINGVEVKSADKFEAESEPMFMSVTSITDPLDAGTVSGLKMTLLLREAQVRYLKAPMA